MSESLLDLACQVEGGTFSRVCPRLWISPSGDPTTIVLDGCGTLASDEHGTIRCHLVAPFSKSMHPILTRCPAPGKLIRDEDRVQFHGVDERGSEWESGPCLVRFQVPFGNWIIKHALPDIRYSHRYPVETHVSCEVMFPSIGRLPFDVPSTHKSQTGGGHEKSEGWSVDSHVRVLRGANTLAQQVKETWVRVSASGGACITDEWTQALCDSLAFMTARHVQPIAIERTVTGSTERQLHSGPFWKYHTMLPRPVQWQNPSHAPNYWSLVDKLMTYFLDNHDRGKRLANELRAIRDSGCVTLQAACLTTAVSVEALCSALLPPCAQTVDDVALGSLLDHVASWNGDSTIKRRAQGALAALRRNREIDRLYSWLAERKLSPKYANAWKSIRHPSAHGAGLCENQELVDKYLTTVELVYLMVYFAIGFTEPVDPIVDIAQ